MSIYALLFTVTIGFIIWAEHSVGNIFLRTNSSGGKGFNFSSLFHFMIHPLYNSVLWTRNTLDINYPFVMIISLLIYYFNDVEINLKWNELRIKLNNLFDSN